VFFITKYKDKTNAFFGPGGGGGGARKPKNRLL
jgi:hypothetical protein